MEPVRIRSVDSGGVFPTTLPSPRMIGAADHSTREAPSGFRKSLNPIYRDDTMAVSSFVAAAEPELAYTDHDDDSPPGAGARATRSVDESGSGAVLVRRHTGGDGRWEAIRAADH